MNLNNFTKWLKFSILIFCLILILIGFGFGYIYNSYKNDYCTEDPLSYGLRQINQLNSDNFTCACTSISGNINPFYFDKDGYLSKNSFIISQEKYLIE